MRMIWNKGHRIRASDKHLVYHFSIGTLLFVFVAVLLLLNIKQLMRTDWEHFSLLENGLTLSPYTVKVHVDADGDMVIIQNPTLAPAIEKSDYEPKTPEADASVDADTVNDATAFLETFFKLYPTATEKELAYYVSGNVIEPIGRDYLYSELVNPIFTKDGDNVKVKVAVKFLDNQTKATQVSQYELVLHKDSNWKIVG